MCWCNPSIRTPNCGAVDCHPPTSAVGLDGHRRLERHKAPGSGDPTQILAIGPAADSGAVNRYLVSWPAIGPAASSLLVAFQDGPPPKVGHNGVTLEQLLAICADRLEGFQRGRFRCPENAEALYHLQHALAALHERTMARQFRGVGGKLEP